jgi:hypothetical protein
VVDVDLRGLDHPTGASCRPTSFAIGRTRSGRLLSWLYIAPPPASPRPKGRVFVCVHSKRPKPLSAQRYHPPGHVPPSWFLTTSTVFSAHKVAGLLHPAASHGVRPVLRSHHTPVPKDRRALTTLPVSQAHTLRRVPLHQQPRRITAALAPLAVSYSLHRGEAPICRSRPPRHPSRSS